MNSFALSVKEEIAKKIFDQCCEHAFLAGFIKNNAEIIIHNGQVNFHVSSISNAVIRRVYQSLKQIFPQVIIELAIHQSQKLKFNKLYVLKVKGEGWALLERLGIADLADPKSFYKSLRQRSECCKRAFAAGTFIACGSVNSPLTSNYHLEMQFNSELNAQAFCKFINHFRFNFKIIQRKSKTVCYIKQSSMIADFIKFIDASNSVLEFENTRISRDLKNNINRLNNIDISNQQKTTQTGNEQIMMIEFLDAHKALHQLSDKAQKIATLRLENPEASFNELVDLMVDEYDLKTSKSGINHLFREIKQKYETLVQKYQGVIINQGEPNE